MTNIVKKIENEKKIIDTIDVIDEQIDSLKEEVICKSNCKLCNSSLRSEAEELYEKYNRNARKIYLHLQSNSEDISYPSVKNHLENHYLVQMTNITIRDYLVNLKNVVDEKKNKEKHLRLSITILEDRFLRLAAETSGLDHESQSKQKVASQLIELSKSITEFYENLESIYDEERKITILMNQFKEVVSVEINNANDDDIRRALMSVVDNFSKRIEQLSLE